MIVEAERPLSAGMGDKRSSPQPFLLRFAVRSITSQQQDRSIHTFVERETTDDR